MENEELNKLKEKVQALQKQNALLKKNRNSQREADPNFFEKIQLIDLTAIDKGDEKWLLDAGDTDATIEEVYTWLSKNVIRRGVIEKF